MGSSYKRNWKDKTGEVHESKVQRVLANRACHENPSESDA